MIPYHTSDSVNSAGHPPNAMGGCLNIDNRCSGQVKDQNQARASASKRAIENH